MTLNIPYRNLFNQPLIDNSNPTVETMQHLDDGSIIIWTTDHTITVINEIPRGNIMITQEDAITLI